MTSAYRSKRTVFLVFAIVLAIAPMAMAIIRVVQTGSDLRYFWVALAALIGAVGIALIMKPDPRSRDIFAKQAPAAFLASTLLAVRVARFVGARSWPAIFAVCIVFALFFTASVTLYALSRR